MYSNSSTSARGGLGAREQTVKLTALCLSEDENSLVRVVDTDCLQTIGSLVVGHALEFLGDLLHRMDVLDTDVDANGIVATNFPRNALDLEYK